MKNLEIFEELKNNMLKQLQVESRVAKQINSDNYSKKDNNQIPLICFHLMVVCYFLLVLIL